MASQLFCSRIAARTPASRAAWMALAAPRPFHAAPAARAAAAYPPEQAPALRPNDRVAQLPSARSSGSYHWDAERLLSVATAALCLAPAVTGAGNPMVDFGLAFAVPLHTHMGFDVVLTDYVPYRKFGSLYTVLAWGLKGLTAVVIYGAYQFNTNDVGITELAKRVWQANTKKE
ncbi:succinate dehydrogenase membrane anchor subunit [Hyaloraphidium curvatum]|nr:succinate dehydrogenase membrane anchor subunit [Hyaloraphidium curvatum]